MNIKLVNLFFREMNWKLFGFENYLKRHFQKEHGYPLNLTNSQSFSEKIQWMKVYGHLERYARYVDKYLVKEFIIKKLGKEIVIPTINVYDKVEEIDFQSLPKSFVLKATHGSKWIIIVKDKDNINWISLIKKMNEWLKLNYYRKHGEAQYKPLKGRILIEEYIEDPSGDLKDYKFFCFHGEPKYIQIDGNRFTNHLRDIYDINWTKIPMTLSFDNFPQELPKPDKLEEMIEISRKLSLDFPFVRVDLYYTSGRIYFGELTFTPGNGMERFTPQNYDYIFGELLDLSKF